MWQREVFQPSGSGQPDPSPPCTPAMEWLWQPRFLIGEVPHQGLLDLRARPLTQCRRTDPLLPRRVCCRTPFGECSQHLRRICWQHFGDRVDRFPQDLPQGLLSRFTARIAP